MKVSVYEGKYTFVFDEGTARLTCLRYGKEWRDLVGDGAVLALVQELDDARTELADLKRANELLSSENRELNFRMNQNIR